MRARKRLETGSLGQAQEAAGLAQTLAAAMAAGKIVHPASGRSIRHCMWLEVV